MRSPTIAIRLTGALLLALPLACVYSPSPLPSSDPMVEVVSAEVEAGRFMGAVLVAVDDQIRLDGGFGSADIEWDIPNTPDTKFRVGSITKQFTAASILILQDRGLLDIDKPVQAYWPSAPEAWDAITVRHLLNHSSGIPNLTELYEFQRFKYLPTTLDELLGRFRDLPLEMEPGERWAYSNSNYILLTAILEAVGGRSYAAFVQKNLFDPLGMRDSGIDAPTEIVRGRASGYALTEAGLANAEYVNMAITQGAGQLYSTTHDLLRWQHGLYDGKVLSADSLAEFTDPYKHDYALGVVVQDRAGDTTIWHSGGIEGFNTWLGHDPDRGITVVVLANVEVPAASSERAATRLGVDLMGLARGEWAARHESQALPPSY